MKSGEWRRILWRDNPLLVYLVGLCPALAVSNRLSNALLLSAVMLFALLGAGVAAVALERWVPPRLRLPVRLVLASALVASAQRFLWAFAPTHAAGLGIYLPLLAVNCLLLASSASGSLGQSVVEAAGRGAAFAAVLGLLALVREVLGAGTITLFPIGSFGGVLRLRGLPPARVLAAAPGALLVLGYLGALSRWWTGRRP
jgi:electron transport complex protein RnfE